MRIHVLGAGSVGSFVSYHLSRLSSLRKQSPANFLDLSIPPLVRDALTQPTRKSPEYSLTLHLKRLRLAESFRCIRLERDGVQGEQTNIRLEVPNLGPIVSPAVQRQRQMQQRDARRKQRELRRQQQLFQTNLEKPSLADPTAYTAHSELVSLAPSLVHRIPRSGIVKQPDTIDSLIVTTKADSTLQALEPLVPRLTPASTVVLLQNGMGVLEDVLQAFFPDPSTRPFFILGNMTHGVWPRQPFDVIHTGFGSIKLGVVPPGPDQGISFQLQTLRPGSQDAGTRRLLSGLDPDATFPVSDADLVTLRYTLLNLLALPLDVHWEPLELYNESALRKVVVNACINATSAIYKLSNGALLHNEEIMTIWQKVCSEAAQVFAAVDGHRPYTNEEVESIRTRPRHHNSPFSSGDVPLQSASSTASLLHDPQHLLAEAKKVARQTANNFSSMYVDLHGVGDEKEGLRVRTSTEVRYINGYLSKLGRMYGVSTPVNDDLVVRVEQEQERSRVRREAMRASRKDKSAESS